MKSGRERLKDWIDRSRCSQNEAAEILGITAPYLSQLLSGVRTPGLANAIKFERITGISAASWLLTDVSHGDPLAIADGRNSQE